MEIDIIKSQKEFEKIRREETGLDLQKRQLEIQEKQHRILSEQKEISDKQTNFSKILALATIVLAIGAFLQTSIQIMNLPSEFYQKLLASAGIGITIIALFGLMGFITIMGVITYLLILLITSKKI